MALPLMTGVTHSSAQLARPYPAIFNSSIMPQSIAATAKAISYTNATTSAIDSDYPIVNLDSPVNRTKQSALDNQACCFMVQDTLEARFWGEYRTLTATFTRATTIIASVTRYIDTTIKNFETVDSLTNTSSIYISQVGSIPPFPTIGCNVPIMQTGVTMLNDIRTEPNKTMSTSMFYVYSTVKIIQVPAVTRANGLLQCTTKSELLQCQPSITIDYNPYLGSYYLSRPTAAIQLPGALSYNAVEPTANASVHVDTILTFPTPFTYLPSVSDTLERLGYVPRSILDMLQHDAFTGHASLLTSCSPGGPPLINSILPQNPSSSLAAMVDTIASNVAAGVMTAVSNVGGAVNTAVSDVLTPCAEPIAIITDGLGDMAKAGPVMATPGKDLTVSTAITVTSAGCFNPEACPNIRASQTLKANGASADFISQTVESGAPATTVARSKLDGATGTADMALPLLFTFGGRVFTPYPAGFSIGGTTISAGGQGVTIAGTAIHLESSGILRIGSSVISMKNTAVLDDLQPTAYSVGGQVFTPNWTAFRISGTTISAEGPGVTIAGTPVRLEASGTLKIGTSVASIANVASTTGNSRLATVGTAIFTPSPTASAGPSTAVSEAGSIITVSVTPDNLETSRNQGTGGSVPTLTPKNPPDSRSGCNVNPIVKKRLGILLVMYLICQILAL